jgi:hypothetical protein
MKIGTIMGVLGAAAAVAAIAIAPPVRAAEINPLGYTFDAATDCGTYCYTDTGGELTDGVLGNEGWANPPEPWVGWTDGAVNIDFDFGSAFTFASVAVGTTQDDLRDVVLPSLDLFSSDDGVSWTARGSIFTPADAANNRNYLSAAPHGFLTFSGLAFASRYVRLTATNMGTGGTWIFLDEVNFDGRRISGTTVPEPQTWLLMLVGFFALGGMLRASRPAFVR